MKARIFLFFVSWFVAVPNCLAESNSGLNIAGLAGVGIPLKGGNLLFTSGAALAYHAQTGVQVGAELDTTLSGTTLMAQLDYFVSSELFLGVQTGLGLYSTAPFLIGAQLGLEPSLVGGLLTLGPKLEYLFRTDSGASTLEILAALKLHL